MSTMTEGALSGATSLEGSTAMALRIRGLGRRFGRKWAIRDLDLNLPRGAACGLLGLNGAGKSTTLRMLMGLLPPDEGWAEVCGLDPTTQGLEVKTLVGYVPDSPPFYEWMTVAETLAFVGHHRKPRWQAAHATSLLDGFGVDPSARVDTLSKGQRAKVALVMALGFKPDLLLLDEPLDGLDPLARRQFLEGVLGEFADGEGTVVISSHQVAEIAGLVDHVAILGESRLLVAGRAEHFLGRLRRVRLAFPDGENIAETVAGQPAMPAGARIHSRTVDGREAELRFESDDPDAVAARIAEGWGARLAGCEPMALEEAFVTVAGAAEVEGKSSRRESGR